MNNPSSPVGPTRCLSRCELFLAVALASLLGGHATGAGAPPSGERAKGYQQKILFYAKALRDSLTATKPDKETDPEKKITYMTPADALWAGLVYFQAQGGDFEGASETADIHRETDDQGFAYGFIAAAQAQAGDVAGAKASAKHFRVDDAVFKYWLPSEIALAEARAGDWKTVKEMMTPPAKPGEKDTPAGGLVDALDNGVLAGSPQEIALLDQVLALAPEIKGESWFDLQSLQALQAVALARAGKLDQSRAMLAKITDLYLRFWILRNIALQQAWAGDRQGARETLAPARALLDAKHAHEKDDPDYPKPDTSTDWSFFDYCTNLSHLADTQTLIGDTEGAKKTLETLKEEKVQDVYSPALAELAARQADAGDLAGAEETARSNPDINQRAKGLGLVAQAQIKQGHPEGARRDVEEAMRLLRENKEKKGDFSNANPNARPVSLALAQLDGAEAGVRFAQEMEPDDRGVRSIEPTQDIATMIAERQAPAEVQKWVESQTDDPHVRAMYYRVIGNDTTASPATPYSMDTE